MQHGPVCQSFIATNSGINYLINELIRRSGENPKIIGKITGLIIGEKHVVAVGVTPCKQIGRGRKGPEYWMYLMAKPWFFGYENA